MKTASADEDLENQDHSYIAGGNANSTTTLEDSLVVSLKTKYATTMQPGNCPPEHLSQKNKNLCSHKNLFTNVYSNFIHNSQTLATTTMSFNG